MNLLLKLSRAIDAASHALGKAVMWLVLAAVLISTANAVVRKAFNMSSNAYLEIQWYLFAAVFLLGAGYTLLRNEHVRIDALANRWTRRTQIWIDIVGMTVFMLPLCWWIVSMSLPLATRAFVSGEVSTHPGGLIRWPVYMLLPVGFSLLALQVVSEIIKRVAFLKGLVADPAKTAREKSADEHLLEALRQQNEGAAR